MRPRSALILLVACFSALDAAPAFPAPAAATPRWTDATPDAMIDDAVARTLAADAPDHARLAAMAVVVELSDRGAHDHARTALQHIADAAAVPAELRAQAAMLGRELASDEGTQAGAQADHALGIVDAVSILGPFRDTGGGLDAHDGPEAARPAFAPTERYSWGSYEVAWRPVEPTLSRASGVPLDLFVFPRKESCTWVATQLAVSKAQPLVVSVAGTGQLRLRFDGADVARDDSVHTSARFDRIAAGVEATAGAHLVAVKTCSGPLDDDGRVRLRVTNEQGAWPEGVQAHEAGFGAAKSLPRPVVRARTTALAVAIQKPGADVDARLDAAILRTFGGADDSRSPRAPGLPRRARRGWTSAPIGSRWRRGSRRAAPTAAAG